MRWVALTNSAGVGLMSIGAPRMEISASHHSADDLFAATHTQQMTPREETILNLDLMQMGLGSASCGPATLPAYVLEPGAYSFSVHLRPFMKNEASPGQLVRTALPAEN